MHVCYHKEADFLVEDVIFVVGIWIVTISKHDSVSWHVQGLSLMKILLSFVSLMPKHVKHASLIE